MGGGAGQSAWGLAAAMELILLSIVGRLGVDISLPGIGPNVDLGHFCDLS